MLQMFYVTVWGKAAESWNSDEVIWTICMLSSDSPVLLGELYGAAATIGLSRSTSLTSRWMLGFDCPLDLHCTYTRDQTAGGAGFL